MLTTAGPTALAILTKAIGLGGGIGDFERSGIGAVAGSFLTAHSVSCEGAADEGGGDGGEQNESRCEAVRAQTCKERFHRFEDLFTGSANGVWENSKRQS